MGGLGSGPRRKKRTVAECFSLDVNRLLRMGLFHRPAGRLCWQDELAADYELPQTENGERQLVLSHSTDWPEQRISLATTRLVSGGLRWWFVCPRCDRRAAKLYLPPTERMFGCRVCYDLAYPPSRACRERRLPVNI